MDAYQIALKTMHFPAGLVARGFVEFGREIYAKSVQKEEYDPKLKKKTVAIGIGVPTLDTILEYTPVKGIKDGLVQQITHGISQPPNIDDQINDAGWFWFGYFFPEVLSIYKQGLTHIYQKIKEKI